MQPNGWRVTNQRHTERYMPSGNFEDVVEVTVQSTDGTYKTLIVPAGQYTPDTVIALANDWAERHAAVASLGNG
jgi:hypothetical protein